MRADLRWTPNTEEDLSHYNVYYGLRSGVYSMSRQEADPNAVIYDLRDGVTYYFAVTAVDSSGNESNFSAEVTKINRFVPLRRKAL